MGSGYQNIQKYSARFSQKTIENRIKARDEFYSLATDLGWECEKIDWDPNIPGVIVHKMNGILTQENTFEERNKISDLWEEIRMKYGVGCE